MSSTSYLERLAAASIFLAVCGGAYLLLGIPVQEKLRELDRRIGEDTQILERLSAGGASKDSYEDALERLSARIAQDPRFLNAASEALAVAALQSLVQSVVDGKGGTIRSIQEVEAEASDDTRPVKVRAVLAATYPDIVEILYDLETLEPYLIVDRLSIKSPSRGQATTAWQPLSVQFDVIGFLPPRTGS